MSGAIWLRGRPGEIEVVVEIDGSLADYALWRPGAPDGFGDLHRGRVSARVPSLGGAFVALEGEQDGFLPDRDLKPHLGVGALLGARIVRSAHGGKGPKLDADPDVEASTGPLRLIRRGRSPLDDLLAAHPELPVRTASPGLAAAYAAGRIVISPDRCPPDLEDEVASLRGPAVVLPGGARASICPTPALIAIDVDSGSAGEPRAGKQSAQFAVNRALLPPLLHQLRLRNLSGAILLDLAGLAARKRALLVDDFAAALARDPLRPRLLGFTALGLAEIVRVRRRPALHEVLSHPHSGAVAAASALAAAPPGAALHAAPDLARVIQADPAIGRDLASALGRSFMVRSDPGLEAGHWKVVTWTP